MNTAESNVKAAKTLKDTKYFDHAISREREFLYQQYGFDIWSMPVCEKCERVALWHKNHTAICRSCGHETKKPITVEQFLMDGNHRGLFDRTQYVGRKKADKISIVYGGEAGLSDEDKKIIIAQG
jgi:hypothetical protein